MSGVVFALGDCIACGALFTFNPLNVPSSTAITGTREPICASCIERINARRRESGLPEWTVAADAYGFVEESEL